MSIHSLLAVLLGSTALGGFAPLTLTTVARHTITGVKPGFVGISQNQLTTFIGPLVNHLQLAHALEHMPLGPWGVAVIMNTEHTLLGFRGIMATEAINHTFIWETEQEGYGYNYGMSYGG